jgi:hypothetical protein
MLDPGSQWVELFNSTAMASIDVCFRGRTGKLLRLLEKKEKV